MSLFAHVGGVPVEELLPAAGAGTSLLVMRAWLGLRLRYRRRLYRRSDQT